MNAWNAKWFYVRRCFCALDCHFLYTAIAAGAQRIREKSSNFQLWWMWVCFQAIRQFSESELAPHITIRSRMKRISRTPSTWIAFVRSKLARRCVCAIAEWHSRKRAPIICTFSQPNHRPHNMLIVTLFLPAVFRCSRFSARVYRINFGFFRNSLISFGPLLSDFLCVGSHFLSFAVWRASDAIDVIGAQVTEAAVSWYGENTLELYKCVQRIIQAHLIQLQKQPCINVKQLCEWENFLNASSGRRCAVCTVFVGITVQLIGMRSSFFVMETLQVIIVISRCDTTTGLHSISLNVIIFLVLRSALNEIEHSSYSLQTAKIQQLKMIIFMNN